jgi:hypothetical protein
MDFKDISKLSEQLIQGLQRVNHKLAIEKREDLVKNPEFISAKAQLKLQLDNLKEAVKLSNDTSTRS